MLAERYLTSKKEEHFEELYKELHRKWDRSLHATAASLDADVHDLCAVYDDILLKVLNLLETSPGDFISLLNSSIKRAKISLLRKSISRRRFILVEEGERGDSDAPTFEFASDYNLEDHVIDLVDKKKEADKRQLIDFLLQSAKTDSVTMAVVTNFPRYKSITALAKALGLHHEVVKRKLRRLSRHYDANRFGDIRDHLAV